MQDFDSKEAIIKLTDGSTIRGRVNIRNNARLSDLLNHGKDQFLVVFDISFREELGRVIFINKAHILWIAPVDPAYTR